MKNKKYLKHFLQQSGRIILATVGQNKVCDSLPAIGKCFDIVRKETAEAVVDEMIKETSDELADLITGSEQGFYQKNLEIVKEIMNEFKIKL